MIHLSFWTPAEAEEVYFASTPENEQKEPTVIKILNRFELSNDYGQASSYDNGAMLRVYQRGLISENDVSKFYSATSYNDRVKENWKKVSFSMFEDNDKKLRVDVQPRDRAVMLKLTIKTDSLSK